CVESSTIVKPPINNNDVCDSLPTPPLAPRHSICSTKPPSYLKDCHYTLAMQPLPASSPSSMTNSMG
ncbi:unnamed protein product, partial [Ilex paraguariensis]